MSADERKRRHAGPGKNEACSTNEDGCENFICIENAQLLSRAHVFMSSGCTLCQGL